jgi:hypothetical protein
VFHRRAAAGTRPRQTEQPAPRPPAPAHRISQGHKDHGQAEGKDFLKPLFSCFWLRLCCVNSQRCCSCFSYIERRRGGSLDLAVGLLLAIGAAVGIWSMRHLRCAVEARMRAEAVASALSATGGATPLTRPAAEEPTGWC